MLGKLLTITSIIFVGLVIATIVFIVVEYCKGCEERKSEVYNLWLKAKECQEKLKVFEDAPVLYEIKEGPDEEYKAIKVKK